VVLARVAQPLVAGGQGGVDLAGVVGGEEQRLAQHVVTGLGDSGTFVAEAGLVDLGHQPGVVADRGQIPEPLGVAEPAQDGRGQGGPDPGRGGDDAGRVGLGVERGDPVLEGVDLVAEPADQPGFGGDVLGQLGEVDRAGRPEPQRLGGRGEQLVGLVLPPHAAAAADQQPGQPGPAEPLQRMRIGVALEDGECGLAGLRADGGRPRRAEQLQQRLEPLHSGGAAGDQVGPVTDRTAQRLGRTQARRGGQAVGVQQRQPGQQLAVQPVGLGVLVVVAAQVGRLLRRHHPHRGAASPQPGRQRHPRVTGRLHHHRDRHVADRADRRPQRLQLGAGGAESPVGPDQPAGLVGKRGPVLFDTGHVDAQPQFLHRCSSRLDLRGRSGGTRPCQAPVPDI
jgi:hypothetical protein